MEATDARALDEGDRSIDRVKSLPFILVHILAIAGVVYMGWSWRGLALAVALYYVRMFFFTAGYPRYFPPPPSR